VKNSYSLATYQICFESREGKLGFRYYEEFIFNWFFQKLIEIGFEPLPEYVNSNYKIVPKFSKRRGLRTYRISITDLEKWISPSLVLKHTETDDILSIYYDGYPLIRERLRPDISLILGQILPKVEGFGYFEQAVSIYRRLKSTDELEVIQKYIPIFDDFGPETLCEGKPLFPRIILDPTLEKTEKRLSEQINSYLKIYRPYSIIIFSKSALSYAHSLSVSFGEKVQIIDEFTLESETFQTKDNMLRALLLGAISSI